MFLGCSHRFEISLPPFRSPPQAIPKRATADVISDLAGNAWRKYPPVIHFYLFDHPLEGIAVPGMLSESRRKSTSHQLVSQLYLAKAGPSCKDA
jgi:hypothetical protein